MAEPTSAQYSLTLRVRIEHRPGFLGRVTTAIGEAAGSIGSIDLITLDDGHTVRDITVDTAGPQHGERIAMANPNPEVAPEEAAPYARIIATGRSDYPNQINNVLCFPGVFRGALDVRARQISEKMKTAAAYGIAAIVADADLREDYIVPSVFNRDVAPAVADAVAAEAKAEGAATAEFEIGYAAGDGGLGS